MQVHLHSINGLFTVHGVDSENKTITIYKQRKMVQKPFTDVRLFRQVRTEQDKLHVDTITKYTQWYDDNIMYPHRIHPEFMEVTNLATYRTTIIPKQNVKYR